MKRPQPRTSKRINSHDKEALVAYIQAHPEEKEGLLKAFFMTEDEYALLEKRILAHGRKGGMVTRTQHLRKKEKEECPTP